MKKSNFQLLQLCILLSGATLIVKANNLIDDGHNLHQHVEVLDPEGKYKLEWLADWEGQRIIFNLTVKTIGFIKFGISKDYLASNPERQVDFVIGGVDLRGETYFINKYSVGNDISVVDDQDWVLHSASENGLYTSLSFSRRFDTGDPRDIIINDDTIILVWGYGLTDYIAESERTIHQGDIAMYLRDPDLTPLVIQGARNIDHKKHVEGTDVKIWTISNNFDMLTKRTTYWCRIHKLSLPKKHHMIGYTFNINNETKSNVHHLLLYHCQAPNNPASIFEPWINHPGEECYAQGDAELTIPYIYCFQLKIGYAAGARSVFFPHTMGIPLGESGHTDYFLMQTHYDNPTGRTDLRSEITIDAYYTPNLRPNDGGILNIGHHIPGAPSILLPPGLTDHKIHGHCSPTCTSKMLPPEGIKIVVALLHAHDVGRRVAAQHFRGDVELTPILDDANWKLDFQATRLLPNEVTILPGDRITINCYYDTTSENQTIVGGYAVNQEMCTIFAPYYTLLPEYPICRSELISPEYAARYLAGLSNVTWDRSRLEFVATEPEYLAGLTISEISDSIFGNWNSLQETRLQDDHDLLPQVDVCLTIAELQALAQEGVTPHCKSLETGHSGSAPWCKNDMMN